MNGMPALCDVQVMCKLFYFVQNLTYSCSVLILTLISLERYIAIRHPMLNRRFGATRAIHGVSIGSAWLLSGLYSLPWLVAHDTVNTGTGEVFCINTRPINTRIYVMVNFFVLYVVPLVFLTFVYVRISITLWRSSTIRSLPLINLHLIQHDDQRRESNSQHLQHSTSHSTSSARPSLSSWYPNSPTLSDRSSLHSDCRRSQLYGGLNIETSAPAVPAERRLSANELAPPVSVRRPTTSDAAREIGERRPTQQNADHNPLLSRRKVVRLLAAVVISFALCMLPHHVRVQWQEWRSAHSYEEMYIPPITTLIFYVNSCLNPLLYALISDKFRQAFIDLRCCRQSRTVLPPSFPLAPMPAQHRRVGRCYSQPNCFRPVRTGTRVSRV